MDTNKTQKEFDILKKTHPDAIILEYENEVLSLVKKFKQSGQSYNSYRYTIDLLLLNIESLLKRKPLSLLQGTQDEFGSDILDYYISNDRCLGVYHKKDTQEDFYSEAICFVDETGGHHNLIDVYLDATLTDVVNSTQKFSYPFRPRTFYIDVCKIYTNKDDDRVFLDEDHIGQYSYYVKSPHQLDAVYAYYKKGES